MWHFDTVMIALPNLQYLEMHDAGNLLWQAFKKIPTYCVTDLFLRRNRDALEQTKLLGVYELWEGAKWK